MTEHPHDVVTPLLEVRADHGRFQRTGIAEAVYGPGKSPRQCARAVEALLEGSHGPILLTRADAEQTAMAQQANPGAVHASSTPSDGLATLIWRPEPSRDERVVILTAGTGDLPVAREATALLEAYGCTPELVADVGVAGLHRVLAQQQVIAAAEILIVVAGMEGALASVVAGMTRAPIIAVPTSTGYGAGLEGITALLSMLATCSPGVSVVGIDNGFGAGCAAIRILNGMRDDR